MRGRFGSVLLLMAIACGSDSGSGSMSGSDQVNTTGTGSSGYVITVSDTFRPLDLHVPAGATVTVVNADGVAHSVTSEATSGSYQPGAVSGISFDTGVFSSGQRTFTIPGNATPGTVIPYYCTTHLAGMTTPNGTITVDAAAAGSMNPPY